MKKESTIQKTKTLDFKKIADKAHKDFLKSASEHANGRPSGTVFTGESKDSDHGFYNIFIRKNPKDRIETKAFGDNVTIEEIFIELENLCLKLVEEKAKEEEMKHGKYNC